MSGTVISGVGAVTGYGWGRDRLWQGLTTGKSPAELAAGFGSEGAAGWVVRVPDGGDDRDGASRFTRAMRWAAREAIEDALARGWVAGRRVGLVHAIVLGDLALYDSIRPDAPVRSSVRDYLALSPSTPVSLLMREYGFRGPAIGVSAMCTSGGAALLTAKSWIDTDVVDDVVVLATDLSAVPELVDQFVRLGVAVTDAEPDVACRPFQATEPAGSAFGEVVIGFVLSNSTGAPYARLLGGAMTHDAYHVTHIDPDLAGVGDCFAAALGNAGVDPRDVSYLNAHGPGTKQWMPPKRRCWSGCSRRRRASIRSSRWPGTAKAPPPRSRLPRRCSPTSTVRFLPHT